MSTPAFESGVAKAEAGVLETCEVHQDKTGLEHTGNHVLTKDFKLSITPINIPPMAPS